ncbi:phospho-acceptor domain-containing protein [Sinobacterium caligoides]|uniref:histidine kinase n=1 Tax=Sinobacterium caligoides TaxID=933926 RepID=A0A3N2DG63_9GAMM|nr:response regulator [Sinobacterium caligoides]ROR98782.1 phospho-acceptor domain-containing protein [Sinobacterium caligoides]
MSMKRLASCSGILVPALVALLSFFSLSSAVGDGVGQLVLSLVTVSPEVFGGDVFNDSMLILKDSNVLPVEVEMGAANSVSFQSILYGVLFSFFCFYLFIGLRLRRSSQLYFVTYIFLVVLLVLCRDYSLLGWLVNDHAESVYPLLLAWLKLLVLAVHVLFISSYMKSRTTQPNLYISLCVLLCVSLALAVVMPFQSTAALKIMLPVIYSLFVALSMFLVGFGVQQKIAGAKYLFVAVLCAVVGFVVSEMVEDGLLLLNEYSYQALVIGVVAEVLLFGFCLADKLAISHQRHRYLLTSTLKAKDNELKAYEQSNKLKNQFLAAISHELRTPMNGVVAAIDILTPDNPDRVEREKYLQLANSSAEDMTRLLDKLLSFAELQSGAVRAKESQFNLRELIVDLCERYEERAQRKGINLQLFIDQADQLCVLGDVKKLREIISQLIDNAVKFTDHGSVVVRLDVLPAETDLTAVISVTDTGVGIQATDKQSVFNAFEQQDAGCDRRYSGLGIGLSICQQLANIMGGELSYESEEVIGCTFTLSVPLRPAQKQALEAEPEVIVQNRGNIAPILIVEDNYVNQLVLKGMLTKLGYEVLTADNGIEALSVMDRYAVSIVLMDCQMPEMDGFEATKRIRAGYEAGAEVPIIAVTANAMEFDTERCIAVGMNDFIKKPVRKKILMKKLLYWLNKRPAAKNNVEF